MGFVGVNKERMSIVSDYKTSKFTKEIEVPDWEFCNEHNIEKPDKVSEWHCPLIRWTDGSYYCKLFCDELYSCGKKVLKCEACLKACEVGHG